MRIAIFCQQLEYMGGIERVVLEQLRIFKEHDAIVDLLIDREPKLMRSKISCQWQVLGQDELKRKEQLQTYLKVNRPDALIFHGVSHAFACQDVQVAKENGVRTACVIHFPFVSNLALGGGEYNSWRQFFEDGRGCTAFATVSKIDSVFWRGLGKKAFHVQNPFVHPSKNVETIRRHGEDGSANLLWVGRLCEPKQPKAALAAFALAARECPNISLTMVGGDECGIRQMRKEAVKLGVVDKVKFVAEQPDIGEYWAKADIHLLTSICESFCLVWAEAKAAGIPTVMFELPYLELAEDGRGYVAVEQKNVQALANAIVSLSRNGEHRLALGEEARESLARFNDEAVWESWCRLFDGLKDPGAGLEVDADLTTIVRQMYFAVCHDKETHRWPEEMTSDWLRLTKTSMRPFANLLSRVVDGLASIKRRLRG